MTTTHPLAAWVERLQRPSTDLLRGRTRPVRKFATLDDGAVRLSRGRSVLPPGSSAG